MALPPTITIAAVPASARPRARLVPRSAGHDGAGPTDAHLLDAIASGSRAAMADLYERYSPRMHRAAARIRGADDADDIIQEVFLRLWDLPTRFDPRRGSLGGYLMMQTRGRAIDAMRSDAARRAREDRGAVERPGISRPAEETAMEHAATEATRTLLALVTGPERDAIALAYFGGRTYREVAALLGEPEGTVKSRIRSGLRRLQEILVSEDGADPVALNEVRA